MTKLSGILVIVLSIYVVAQEETSNDMESLPLADVNTLSSRALVDSALSRLWRRGKRAVKEEAVNAVRKTLLDENLSLNALLKLRQ